MHGSLQMRGQAVVACLALVATFVAGTVVVGVASLSDSMLLSMLPVTALALLAAGLTHGVIRRTHQRQQDADQHADRQLGRLERELPLFEPRKGGEADGNTPGRLDELVRRADLVRRIAEGTHGLEIIMRPDESAVWVSLSVEDLCGVTTEQCLQADSVLDLIALESDRGYCRQVLKRQLERNDRVPESFELRVFGKKDNTPLWMTCQVTTFLSRDEDCLLRFSAQEIQEQKEAEQRLLDTVSALHRSRALSELYLSRSTDERLRLTALLDTIRLGILFFDRDHRVLYANKAIQAMCGFIADESLIGMRDVVIQSRVAPLLELPHIYLEHVDAVLSGRDDGKGAELRFKDGRIVTEQSVVVGEPGGRRIGRMWVYEDVTEQRRVAERLVELAERDPLTKLLNRRRFHDDLALMLADAVRSARPVALIAFDLDGFKPVNDVYGHQAGDKVLVGVAGAVGGTIRRNESLYRMGGDEFAVLVRDADTGDVLELAARIVSTVSETDFCLGPHPVSLSASVGIAFYPDHATDEEGLIAAADMAMYAAKQNGRNQFVLAACGSS